MTYTENYALNQWAKTDRIQMSDFNADNAKIDAALSALPKLVTGTYTGNGEATRTLDLGFTPKLVFLSMADGTTRYQVSSGAHFFAGGLALPDSPITIATGSVLAIVDGGIQINYGCTGNAPNYTYRYSNADGVTYRYLAIQ